MERLTERYKDSIANTVLIRECGDKLCNYNGDRKHGSGAKTQRKVEPLIPFGTLSDDGDSDALPFM